MPVATAATSSAGTSSMQMMNQSQSGNAMSSSGMSSMPPNGRKKCPPSPTPNFNARSLPKGKFQSHNFNSNVVLFPNDLLYIFRTEYDLEHYKISENTFFDITKYAIVGKRPHFLSVFLSFLNRRITKTLQFRNVRKKP